MADSDNAEFGLVMPFVVVRSKGGPYDDGSFVAGYEMGQLDAALSMPDREPVHTTIHEPNRPQADLLAMRHDYTMVVVSGPADGWLQVRFDPTPQPTFQNLPDPDPSEESVWWLVVSHTPDAVWFWGLHAGEPGRPAALRQASERNAVVLRLTALADFTAGEPSAAPHIVPKITDRGFAYLPPVAGTHDEQVQVYESSAAEYAAVWLSVKADGTTEPVAHLTLDAVTQLRDQLTWMVENHYQVRPR